MEIEPHGYAESSEISEVLDILQNQTRYTEALGCLCVAERFSDERVERGVVVSDSVFRTVTGDSGSVSLPMSGSTANPAMYLHSQPGVARPSKQDVEQTWSRGERCQAAIALTDEGDYVNAFLITVPDEETRNEIEADPDELWFNDLMAGIRVYGDFEQYKSKAEENGLL